MLGVVRELLAAESGRDTTLLIETRRTLLTLTSLITFVFALLWVALTAGTVVGDRPFLGLLCGLVPIVFLPFPIFARSTINFDLLAHVYVALLYVSSATVAGALGGMVSTTSFFMMLVPMLASMLLGLRAGLAWLALVLATFVTFHFVRAALPPSTYEAIGVRPDDWIRAEEISLWNTAVMTLLAVTSSIVVANFRAVVQKSSTMVVNSAIQARDALDGRRAAEEISRSKSEFIATVSHEFRTPLNAIVGYSELLLEGAQDDGRESDARDAQRVLDASKRLLSMVNEMLRLSAIEAGRHKVSVDECDINALIDDAVVAMTPAIAANGNKVVVEPFPAQGFWLCDGAKLDHCLRHLLSNAGKFTRNGDIIVRASRDPGDSKSWLQIEVADTGIGIEASELDNIFRPFALTNAAAARKQGEGAGLGLAVTRQMLRLMGGDVAVASAPGQGSRFTMRVPADFLPDAA